MRMLFRPSNRAAAMSARCWSASMPAMNGGVIHKVDDRCGGGDKALHRAIAGAKKKSDRVRTNTEDTAS